MTDTKMVPLDSIEIQEGFNPRTTPITDDSINDLAKSIEQVGILTSLTVRPNGSNDTFLLVAGERRLRAARKVGLDMVPVIIREDDTDELPAAMTENMHRTALKTSEIVAGVAQMKAKGYTSQKAIAEKLAIKPAAVAQAIQLHQLGPVAVEMADTGQLPINKLGPLTALLKASPEAVRVVLEVIKATGTTRLVEEPLSTFAPHNSYYLKQLPEGTEVPTCFELDRSYDVTDLELSEEAKALATEFQATTGHDPQFVVTDDVITAAEARGAVYRWKDPRADDSWDESSAAFFDPELAAILVEDNLKAWKTSFDQKIAKANDEPTEGEGSEEAEDDDAPSAIQAKPSYLGGSTPPADPEAEKAKRKAEREKRIKDQVTAEAYNDAFGKQLFDRLDEVPVTRESIEAVLLLAVHDGPSWLSKGLRYVHPGHRVVEGDEGKEKIRYTEEPAKKLTAFFDGAKTPEQLLGRFFQLITAASYADDRALARSNRRGEEPRPTTLLPFTVKHPTEVGLKKLTPAMRKQAESNYRARQKG